jgi:hydroxypyruvate isomerase
MNQREADLPASRAPGEALAPTGETLAAVRTFDLRFDVNCSILFSELPLLKRPAAARTAGFEAVEFQALFGQLAAQGYAGWIGCEYKPADPADSLTSFGWR